MKGFRDVIMYQNDREVAIYKSSMDHLNASRARTKELKKQRDKLLDENRQLRNGYSLELVSHENMILDPIVNDLLLSIEVNIELESENQVLIKNNHAIRKEKHQKTYR